MADAPNIANEIAGTYTPGRDLLLDSNGDLDIVSDLQFSTGPAAIAQSLQLTVTLWQGEWFRNTDLGLPWQQEILGGKPTEARLYAIFRSALVNTYGVEEILSLEITNVNRVYTIAWEVRTEFGVVSDSLEF